MALKIVSRKEWGAKAPKVITRRPPSQLSGVAVHWFESPRAAASHAGCAALLRSVQNTHMAPGGLGVASGGNDIAYNHAVCPHGVAFELRGFGVQTGANGTSAGNQEYAAVVYMAGTGDTLTPAATSVIGELIRMWQAKGAGPLVKPHNFFVSTGCPGPDLLKWVARKPAPWLKKGGGGPSVPQKDEAPPWLADFILWRVELNADPKLRPKTVPKRIPQSAWEAAAVVKQMSSMLGPQQSFLDWVEWRRGGAKKKERPRSLPAPIPKSWWDALKRLEGAAGKGTAAGPKPRPKRKTSAAEPAPAGPVTARTKLLAPPRATRRALQRYVLGRQHGYSDDRVRSILEKYAAVTERAGLDPLLVVAQMVHETGNLTSAWSQPPHRNPAGIGVTGEPGAGVSFRSWDKAIRAHVGRLLAYAISKGQENGPQRKLIEEALGVRPLPDSLRGTARTLAGLTGKWATDPRYADKIAAIANEARKAA